jgi:hypothetical protein
MAKVLNTHYRDLPAQQDQVAALVASLSDGREDNLWPWQTWPAMRFDGGLLVGATGGHGPIRYRIEAYELNRYIWFRFVEPKGFDGRHGYLIIPLEDGRTRLEHRLEMRTHGSARYSWPLVFRPLHDALIEDSLNRAEEALHRKLLTPPRWSLWVRVLRAVLR